jgi:hypothetical protein
MIIISEATLDLFRGPGPCENCGKWCRRREPHHYKPKGFGGGSRLDMPENLISLGSTPNWECQCHNLAEAKKIPPEKILATIAKREGKTPEEIKQILWDKLREPK